MGDAEINALHELLEASAKEEAAKALELAKSGGSKILPPTYEQYRFSFTTGEHPFALVLFEDDIAGRGASAGDRTPLIALEVKDVGARVATRPVNNGMIAELRVRTVHVYDLSGVRGPLQRMFVIEGAPLPKRRLSRRALTLASTIQ